MKKYYNNFDGVVICPGKLMVFLQFIKSVFNRLMKGDYNDLHKRG